MRILFRTDCSSDIGSGHLMRCLTLAEQFVARGGDVQFVCRQLPQAMLDRCYQANIKVSQLPANPSISLGPSYHMLYDWEEDADLTRQIIGNHTYDWIIVDHYGIDQRWQQKIRSACRWIMVIDDLGNRPHQCDLLLDQNLVANYSTRYQPWLPADCCRLLGPDYAMLQPQYQEFRSQATPRFPPVSRILVYFGGADTFNLTGLTLGTLLKMELGELKMDVVAHLADPHFQAIKDLVDRDSRVRLHHSLPSLAPLMVQADLAVGGGGATSWERCCLGLPTIVVSLADNQLPIARELHRRGVVEFLGEASQIGASEIGAQQLFDSIWRMVHDPALPQRSQACMQLVDGMGINRVIQAIDQISSGQATTSVDPWSLRPVRPEDEALIFGWINDPQVRSQSFHSFPIPAEQHRRWFRQVLEQPDDHRYYLFLHATAGPVGQIRFQRKDSTWEIHFLIGPPFRGRGWGTELVRRGIEKLSLQVETVPFKLIANIKATNQRSYGIFQRLGFKSTQDPSQPETVCFHQWFGG